MRMLTGCVAVALALSLTACGDDGAQEAAGGGAGSAGAGGAAGSAGGAGAGQAGQEPDIPMSRSAAAYDTEPDLSQDDYESFIAETNAFGFDLFHAMADDQNTFLSPTSTVVALAMTYAGAKGETATQMAAAMRSTLEPATSHAAVNQLTLDLESRNIAPHDTQEGEKSLRISPVNGVFAQHDYTFRDSYLDTLSVNYDSGMFLLDFAQAPAGSRETINRWVAYHTEDRIDELLGEDAIKPTTRLVLANALYFYGSWAHAFNEDDTADGTFHTLAGGDVTVPMMQAGLPVPYGQGDGYEIVELPYDGNEMAMTIVLPEEGRFQEIASGIDGAWWTSARAQLSAGAGVSLTLPKFSFTWGTESFADALTDMGMVDAFMDGAADFSGMDGTTNLFIQDVVHQAFVGVDEHGTEAAAATAVIMGFNAAPELEVTVDRPFLFFVTDASGAVVFVGQVTDPS